MINKIHFVHYDTGPGGMEVLLPLIIKNLRNYQISVFALRSKLNGINVYDNTGIKVVHGSNNNFVAFFKTFIYAYRNKNDIFHVYNIGPVFLLILRLAGVKRIIYSLHGTVYWKSNYKKKLLLFFWQRALNYRIVFLANSQHSKNEFLKKIKSGINIQVVYNPIDEKRFVPPEFKYDRNGILVVYSGRLENGKNLTKWIEIAACLHKKNPQTRFELYGEGSLKDSLLKQIVESGAKEYIQLKGFRKDIEKVYQESDLLLFLSEYESFGNVAVESILCGTPLITLPIASMLEIFNEYPEFLLKDDGDLCEQLFLKVKCLNEMKKMATRARNNFLSRFTLAQHINSLEEVYSAIK
jgi:glycosyltransferase involved in cell wall biosynthesis